MILLFAVCDARERLEDSLQKARKEIEDLKTRLYISEDIREEVGHHAECIHIYILWSCPLYKASFFFNGRLWDARWQQTYQVSVHCLRSSEHAHMTENNGFYLVSLLPPSVPKVSH